MKLNINRNQALIIFGLLASLGPEVGAAARWLGESGIPHMEFIVRVLGWVSTALGGLALAWKSLRPVLAAGGLATPRGALAPWVPGKPGDPTLPAAIVDLPSSEAPTPIRGTPLVKPRDPSKGGVEANAIVVVCLVALLAILALMLLTPGKARADQQFGGCFAGGQLCAGPSATVTVGALNLATSKFSGGLSPGLGYGLTFAPDQWYATGLAGYLSFTVGGGEPNHAMPSLMFSFANYVRIGAGLAVTEQDVGMLKQVSLLFGLGSDFGGSPKYTKSEKLRAVREAEAAKAEPAKAAP
jgi:hypothetical protein